MPTQSNADEKENACVAPDIHSSMDAYAHRFAGPMGEYLLSVQRSWILELARPWRGGSVLDVGGGHAQVAPALVELGYDVTIHGSSECCRQRPDKLIGEDRYRFQLGDACALPVPDASFDVVMALRMMAHIYDPARFVGELCRVARHAVILDFANTHCLRLPSAIGFYLKRFSERGTTRRFSMQSRAEVRSMLCVSNWQIDRVVGQFVLPMALHRLLKIPALSKALEASASTLGLKNVIGSPVIIRATPITATTTDLTHKLQSGSVKKF